MGAYKVKYRHYIYQRLIQLNKKPKDLCRVLGITEMGLSKMIDEPGRITLNRVMAIAGFLKCDYDFLIYYLLRCKSIGKDKRGKDEERSILNVRSKNERYRFIE